jgi:hypothetical protein
MLTATEMQKTFTVRHILIPYKEVHHVLIRYIRNVSAYSFVYQQDDISHSVKDFWRYYI